MNPAVISDLSLKIILFSLFFSIDFTFLLNRNWVKKANGETEVGPNAVPVPSPETYSGYLGVFLLGFILYGTLCASWT